MSIKIEQAAKGVITAAGLKRPASAMRRSIRQRWLRTRPPSYPGSRLTVRRFLNYQLAKYQQRHLHERVRGYPLILTIEATNACNLRCPYCFTGAGEQGRDKSMLATPMYEKVLDELGDYLLMIEFYNWGEPFLNKDLPSMIAAASKRGIGTTISTNFSIPFDAARAEEVVRSGLAVLGCSIDGATQEAYEQYRRRGKLETVLANVRLINEAKARLRSATPEVVWEYHVFPHNTHEVELAGTMAAELGMKLEVSKGWVAGPDWDVSGAFEFPDVEFGPGCDFLWQRAIVHNDGGVAPCCATFYREDDFGAIQGEPAVKFSQMTGRTFREVWNNATFRNARALFRNRDGASPETRAQVCFDCPITVMKDNLRKHVRAGRPVDAFEPGFTGADGFNYFFDRRPDRSAAAPPTRDVVEQIELV